MLSLCLSLNPIQVNLEFFRPPKLTVVPCSNNSSTSSGSDGSGCSSLLQQTDTLRFSTKSRWFRSRDLRLCKNWSRRNGFLKTKK